MLILLVDDHPLFLEGIRPLLEKLLDNVELLIAQSCQAALDFMGSHPDLELVLLDLRRNRARPRFSASQFDNKSGLCLFILFILNLIGTSFS